MKIRDLLIVAAALTVIGVSCPFGCSSDTLADEAPRPGVHPRVEFSTDRRGPDISSDTLSGETRRMPRRPTGVTIRLYQPYRPIVDGAAQVRDAYGLWDFEAVLLTEGLPNF